MTYKIGVDGGGTKTECVLVDAAGVIVARHLAPGCNPNIVGPEQARLILTDALGALTSALGAQLSTLSSSPIVATQLFMSGLPGFWSEVAASLKDFGHVTAALDSLPILELATHGAPGLVIHAGTGSFVAARAPDGTIHYAGGTGWRFGDPGSGYELGRRAISRALLELQGWLPASRLGPTVRDHTQLGDAADARAITRFYYSHAEPNRIIAALAPAVQPIEVFPRDVQLAQHALLLLAIEGLGVCWEGRVQRRPRIQQRGRRLADFHQGDGHDCVFPACPVPEHESRVGLREANKGL